MNLSPPPSVDVAIVGAGPVGLLLAALLGAQGRSVVLADRRLAPPAHSMAIGITPPSLKILGRLGLTDELIRQGVQVRDCQVHGESGRLGCVSFRNIPAQHRFVLSLPQSETMSTLQRHLAACPTVSLRLGQEVAAVTQQDGHCDLTFADGTRGSLRAKYVVACEGSRSPLRSAHRFHGRGRSYDVHFAMGDFIDRTELGDEAHLFFKASGSVESFPLPGGLRRWIVQTSERLYHPPPGLISDLVRRRTGAILQREDQLNESTFTPRRLNCDTYHDRRLILCGDAAHVMSPIGGQGMNTGFADAEFLAGAIAVCLDQPAGAPRALSAYSCYRRKAAQSAIRRAGLGMWLGTWTGMPRALLRDFILRHLLCQGPLEPFMGPFYAMLTIPYNTLERVPADALNPQAA